MNYGIIDFKSHGDERGSLIALEKLHNVPFEIKRVYYIFNTTPGVVRGKHAHRELEQVLICTSGSCKILLGDGTENVEVLLDKPEKGLFVGKNIWREMYDFSDGCVLMVLANEYYNPDEYIRDYEEFLKEVNINAHGEIIILQKYSKEEIKIVQKKIG